MNTNELRQRFLDFFLKNKHTEVPSSSLIPGNDPTLLFTNAGMVQFKDVFLGHETRPYNRATSSQRCVRAGGKHNDLDNVGYTARHHTFFEMLGNFSFGDYFKREAIQFAWDFLTKELKLPSEKLWVTVHISDKEAEEIWINEMKIDPTRFSRCDEDNFWSMGDVGPCGPCTEIFYDHGKNISGGPPGSADADGDRYVEVWNLVFMQFNRAPDGSMTPLPKPSVDTGMGLERIAAVMQNVHSNYDIDIFKKLIAAAAKEVGAKELHSPSLKVIADHIRSTSFLIADGVRPSNEGRGYVLRRIIRRAVRHGYKLGMQDPFMYKLVKPLFEIMGDFFAEQAKKQKDIEQVLLQEEQQFSRTLTQGMKIFQQAITDKKTKQLPGDVVFKLYDTYGFPVDLSADMAREYDITLDMQGFEKHMEQQRSQSQAGSKFVMAERMPLDDLPATDFTGYTHTEDNGKIIRILKTDLNSSAAVETLKAGEEGIIILDKTPFYPEGGGQVGDVGVLIQGQNKFTVRDTKKQDGVILHYGEVEQGAFFNDTALTGEVNVKAREATRLNHSATHLLHAALRNVLGTHVVQKGSLVNPSYLRFDFAHFSAVTPEQIRAIEWQVNEQIWKHANVQAEKLNKDEAMKRGALALFEEKYGDEVRVLTMGDKFSVELCGGTHVSNTKEIDLFKITHETGIAAGVRRIEAVTGKTAEEYIKNQDKLFREIGKELRVPSAQFQDVSHLKDSARLEYILDQDAQLAAVAALLKIAKENISIRLEQILTRVGSSTPEFSGELLQRIQQLLNAQRELEKEKESSNAKDSYEKAKTSVAQAKMVNGVYVITSIYFDTNGKTLKEIANAVLGMWPSEKAIACIAAVEDSQVSVIVINTPNLASILSANELLKYVCEPIGIRGGGKSDFAQGGGQVSDDVEAKVKEALRSVEKWVKEKI